MVLGTILGVLVLIIAYFIYSNYTVAMANKYFYTELIDRGLIPEVAKQIMNQENKAYQIRIKSGERGVSLRDHLEEVLENEF